MEKDLRVLQLLLDEKIMKTKDITPFIYRMMYIYYVDLYNEYLPLM